MLALLFDSQLTAQPRVGSFDAGLEMVLDENEGKPVFVSSCAIDEAEQAVLVILASSDSGLLIQYRSEVVVNLARYTFSAGLGASLESHGGAATRDAVAALIAHLERTEFRLVREPSAERLRLSASSAPCRE
jgi:hypothetical protein